MKYVNLLSSFAIKFNLRRFNLDAAVDGYRAAIKCAVDHKVFPEGSAELGDLQAALGSACYAAGAYTRPLFIST